MPAQDPAKQLARELADLRREVRSSSRGSQARFRSLEGGSIPIYDADGNLQGQVGVLPDGTTGFETVNGPKPPQPSAPILFPTIGGLEVQWDGTFWEDADRPGDFRCVEVHASPYSVYTPDETTIIASYIGEGTVFLTLPEQAWTVVFVTQSTSRVRSDASVSATETPEKAPSYTEVIAANGKNKVFWRHDVAAPTLLDDALIEGDIWFKVDHDNAPHRWDADLEAWVEAALGDDAIAGLNVGKLVSGEIAVGQRIIAGPQFGTHAEISNTGFRVFREDPMDGLPDEVVRMGTQTNDYFGVVGQDGHLRAAIDDTGRGNFSGLSVEGDPEFMGTKFSQWISQIPGGGGSGTSLPGATNTVGWHDGAAINGVTSEVGLIEMAVEVSPNRLYLISPSVYWTSSNTASYLTVTVRDGGTGVPTINSPIVTRDYYSSGNAAGWTLLAERQRPMYFGNVSGQRRLLLTVSATGGTANIVTVEGQSPTILVQDLGPARGNPASVNRGGGNTAPPVQQRFIDVGPAGWRVFSGNGTERADAEGPVQGWDQSGYWGDCGGFWWFNIPVITGTVDRVDFYSYTRNWFYPSGGTAIFNTLGSTIAGSNYNSLKQQTNWYASGFPRPGGMTVTLPSWWYPSFRNVGIQHISVGSSGTTDGAFSGSWHGDSARLRIWYTQ